MKTVIAGSRDLIDQLMIQGYINEFHEKYPITEVVSGAAKGVDSIGALWAIKNNLQCKTFPANWDMYGKSAGPTRNTHMAEYADNALIICNNNSSGSMNMYSCMLRYNKPGVLILLKDKKEISYHNF